MRKLLSLVLAFAMILGTFAFPVSADQSTYLEVGNELKGLGVISGVNEAGDLAEMEKLTREQALVVLTSLMGQMDAAKATEAEPGFADVPATHWAAKFVAYAKAQGWTSGVSETEFGLGKEVTTKEALSFMMRALGYTADWAKEDIMKKASELGLMEGVSAKAEDQLVRGELFIVMKNTLYTKPMGEKTELVYKLGLKENPVPETLEVVDVKAENLKQITVEFNQEVDKDTLENAFSSVGLNLSKVVINVQEDGKTVVLDLSQTMQNKKDYKITISKVKSLGGVMMEKVVKEFKTEDNEVPKVEKLVVTGPREFRIHFSEPLFQQGKVKLMVEKKNGPGASVVHFTKGDSVVDVKAGSELKDGTTYTVLVTGFQDFANYKNIDSELELEYAKVTTAPTVEVVKATQEYVVLKFDRPVKGLDNKNFFHTYTAWKPVYKYDSEKQMKADLADGIMDNLKDESGNKIPTTFSTTTKYDTVVIRFLGTVADFVKFNNKDWHPLQVGDVEVNVLGQVGSRKVVDNWGNQLQDTELVVNITADKTAPVIESVEAVGENKVEVTFSKDVIYDRNNYEVLKGDGSKFTGSFTGSLDGNKVTLTLTGSSLVGKSIILNVKNVTDATINMNKMVGTESFNVSFGDKKFEGVKEVYLDRTADQKSIYVLYNEAVDSASATDIRNYKFTYEKDATDGKDQFTISADTSMFSDSVVQLSISNATLKDKFPVGKKVYIVISNEVKDIAGNSWGSFTVKKEVSESKSKLAPKLISKDPIVAKDRKTVVLKFDQPLEVKGSVALNAANFEVKAYKNVNLNPASLNWAKVLTAELENGKKDLALTLQDGYVLSTDLTSDMVKYTSTGANDGDLLNELQIPLASITEQKIKDTLAPEYAVEAGTNDENIVNARYEYDPVTKKHEIVVNFTEALNDAYLYRESFEVRALDDDKVFKVTKHTLDGSKKKLTIEFEVDSAREGFVNQGIADSLKKEPLKVAGTSTNLYTFFNLKVKNDHNVQDLQGHLFSKDSVNVYHESSKVKDLAVPYLTKLTTLTAEVGAYVNVLKPGGSADANVITNATAVPQNNTDLHDKKFVDNDNAAVKALYEKMSKASPKAAYEKAVDALALVGTANETDLEPFYNELKTAYDEWYKNVKVVAPKLEGITFENGAAEGQAKILVTDAEATDKFAYYNDDAAEIVQLVVGQTLPSEYKAFKSGDSVALLPTPTHLAVVKLDENDKVVSFNRIAKASYENNITKPLSATSITLENGTATGIQLDGGNADLMADETDNVTKYHVDDNKSLKITYTEHALAEKAEVATLYLNDVKVSKLETAVAKEFDVRLSDILAQDTDAPYVVVKVVLTKTGAYETKEYSTKLMIKKADLE